MPARNHYCANCLMTRRFHDAKDHMECEHCRRILVKTPLRVAGRPWGENGVPGAGGLR